MKRIVILCVLLMSLTALKTRGQSFTYGVQWGYNLTFLTDHKYDYLDSEGSRADGRKVNTFPHSNAYLEAFIGANINDNFKLTLNSGYAGIADGRRVIPVTLRATFLPAGIYSDGFLYYLDGGVDFDEKQFSTMGLMGTAGFGYRLSLRNRMGLNITANFRTCLDHPKVASPSGWGYIPDDNVRASNSLIYSAGLSLALDF